MVEFYIDNTKYLALKVPSRTKNTGPQVLGIGVKKLTPLILNYYKVRGGSGLVLNRPIEENHQMFLKQQLIH